VKSFTAVIILPQAVFFFKHFRVNLETFNKRSQTLHKRQGSLVGLVAAHKQKENAQYPTERHYFHI
jgi:hypothetical protein